MSEARGGLAAGYLLQYKEKMQRLEVIVYGGEWKKEETERKD